MDCVQINVNRREKNTSFMSNVMLMKCVFRGVMCAFKWRFIFFVFICDYADDVSVSTTSCLPVWWERAGGRGSEGCAGLLWQVPAV